MKCLHRCLFLGKEGNRVVISDLSGQSTGEKISSGSTEQHSHVSPLSVHIFSSHSRLLLYYCPRSCNACLWGMDWVNRRSVEGRSPVLQELSWSFIHIPLYSMRTKGLYFTNTWTCATCTDLEIDTTAGYLDFLKACFSSLVTDNDVSHAVRKLPSVWKSASVKLPVQH